MAEEHTENVNIQDSEQEGSKILSADISREHFWGAR